MSDFRDYFSAHARAYATYRPRYPAAVFEYLASLVPMHDVAWDAGTGNGQAATSLAAHFDTVIATDASKDQITQATPHERIRYVVAPAEAAPIDDESVDLVLAAQAAHWFDLSRFYEEVRRVSRPHAVVALITYALPTISPSIDPYVFGFANQIVGPYWPPERAHIDAGYLTLPFPFAELRPPEFEIVESWTAEDLLNYLGTWSSTRIYMRSHGADPRVLIRDDVMKRWGSKERKVRWSVKMRVGHVGTTPLEQVAQ